MAEFITVMCACGFVVALITVFAVVKRLIKRHYLNIFIKFIHYGKRKNGKH